MMLSARKFALFLLLFPALAATADEQRGIRALTRETEVTELADAMATGHLTAVDLTSGALALIARHNPRLHAVIAVNPTALEDAKTVDAARKSGAALGPLAGIPVLIKDNIETKDRIATTAGSLALKDNVTLRDAPLVARLRAAGAIIIGKANLSEWANIRSSHSVSGWSGMGGLTVNPYQAGRTACGSSSGSGAGVAADLAVLAVGTETDGSVTCPASVNGVVGLKPSLGLISRSRVIPISHSQDTPGPMGHSVKDVAAMLTIISGSDPEDPASLEADQHKIDFAAALSADGLKGVRIGVLRDQIGNQPKTRALFENALTRLAATGATLVDIPDSKVEGLNDLEHLVLMTELKADLNAYLATTPKAVKTRTLADLIAFDTQHAKQEMPWFDQELFIEAEATKGPDDPDYLAALAKERSLARGRLDSLMADNQVTILVSPTKGPAWFADIVNGDVNNGPSTARLPAISGYPHLTVPIGLIQGLPVGISFVGAAWSDSALLQAGYAFEQVRGKLAKAP